MFFCGYSHRVGDAAQDFMDSLISKTAKDIYKKYGFSDFE